MSHLGPVLEGFLDRSVLAFLRRAAAIAEHQGSVLYVVGGLVRDMLLGEPVGDLDVLVEGDAVALAAALATEFGARVRSHTQFHTATLELDAGWERVLTNGTAAGAAQPTRSGDQKLAAGRALSAPAGTSGTPLVLDLITARTEFYERPAALPSVESASLRHDLHRRDFTINTLAVCLNPSRYGQLYDYYGGRRDLERRLVRVLHNLSFIDDPTRIVRAARLAARLQFTIEPRTRVLIADAIEQDLLRRTSAQRVLHELQLTLAESTPDRALTLLDQLGALRAIHPALGWSPELARWLQTAYTEDHPRAALPVLLLVLLLYPLTMPDRADIAAKFPLSGQISRALADVSRIQQLRPELAATALSNSKLDRMLQKIDDIALRAARIAEQGIVAERIGRFLDVLRPTALAINGDALQALGIPPGPIYRTILAELRAAHLDGMARSSEEQAAWVRQQYGSFITAPAVTSEPGYDATT
jgi:tRNA nucleotidyltransferase (CCA-adding enzyme)